MFRELNMKTKIYIIVVYILAAAAVLFALNKYVLTFYNTLDIIFFSLLSVICESLQVYFNGLAISTGFTITLSAIVIYNPLFALIVVSSGMIFRILKKDNKTYHFLNTPVYKTLFNVSIFIISTVISSQVYEFASGKYGTDNIENMLVPIFILSATFLLTDYFLLCLLICFLSNMKFIKVIAQNIKMGFFSIICMVPLGLIVIEAYNIYSYVGVLIIFGPILLARYTFVMYSGIKKSYMDTVKALSLAIEAKDKYTEGHSERVVEYAEKIARRMKFSEAHIENLKISSLLHDIGKIGIPESILNKPGKLTDEEYSLIKEHTLIGANIIKDIGALKNSISTVRHHHERYDGKGYPDGIGENKVPMDAYIISIADAYDAMCSDRPYRSAMTKEQAMGIIKAERGRQFHPKVTDIFLDILNAEGEE